VFNGSRGSSVGTIMGLRLGRPGKILEFCLGIPVGAKDFSRPGREADHSQSSVEVKNSGAIPPLPHMPAWRVA
jgi:hypothetical protein